MLPAAPATPVHTPEKPKRWWPLKRGGGFDGRMKSRILIRLLKEMPTVDQEPTLLLLPPIWQQTQWNRKVKYSGNSTGEAEERRPPRGQTEKKPNGTRGTLIDPTLYLPSFSPSKHTSSASSLVEVQRSCLLRLEDDRYLPLGSDVAVA